jgi:hypothetical protein
VELRLCDRYIELSLRWTLRKRIYTTQLAAHQCIIQVAALQSQHHANALNDFERSIIDLGRNLD